MNSCVRVQTSSGDSVKDDVEDLVIALRKYLGTLGRARSEVSFLDVLRSPAPEGATAASPPRLGNKLKTLSKKSKVLSHWI